jgi:hypothetical protein
MRVLSAPQPFAQLLVRGVKRIEVRSWEPDFEYPARIAIHASTRAPSQLACEDWFDEREPALAFAEQGWADRRDLTALKRGAIVGTATLVAVHVGADIYSGKAEIFAWNHETNRMEVGERDPETGALRTDATPGMPAKVKPLGVTFAKEEHLWVFADPVEFESITGVRGRLRTWTLEGEIEGVIAERERRARKKLWRPSPVNASKREKAVQAWRERWEGMRDYLLSRVESNVRLRRDLRSLVFPKKVEARLKVDLEEYYARNKHPRRADWVLLEPQFREALHDMEIVPRGWFEREIRQRMRKEAEEAQAALRAEARRATLLKIVDEAGPDALTDYSKEGALEAKLEKALDKMLEEEAEDLEFEKRRRNPKFEARLERVRLRQLTRPPTDPGFDMAAWQPLMEMLMKSGLSDDEVAAALAWEQLKTRMMLEGEG